jgi:hypothetical protein
MILYKILMKRIFLLILGLTLILGCTGQGGNEKIIDKVDCESLNDSAMSAFVNEQNFANSIKLIELAVECDPDNDVFIRNKGMILANAGLYQECINF